MPRSLRLQLLSSDRKFVDNLEYIANCSRQGKFDAEISIEISDGPWVHTDEIYMGGWYITANGHRINLSKIVRVNVRFRSES